MSGVEGGGAAAKRSFSVHPAARSAVKATEVILVNVESGRTRRLGYPEACVWELARTGHDSAEIAGMLCHIATIGRGHAELLIGAVLEDLANEGFLVEGERNG
jgi:hypothetical protein